MPWLQWLTRDEDIKRAKVAPYRLLESAPELSAGDPHSPNMLIQGDNLEALKALLPYYAGRVKCIYIDPPYNTRSAFEHYDDSLEHSLWLAMMYPRLELLRELLSEDGSIWVSIDDHEGHYLKVVMDEVFGQANFLCDIAWEKRYSPPPDTKDFGYTHEHVLCYRKSPVFRRNLLPATEDQTGRYKNPDNDPRGPWKAMDYTCRYSADERPNLYYPIIQPNTGEEVLPKRTRVWAMSREVHERHVAENRLWWGKTGKNSVPSLKNFLSEVSQGMMPMSIWKHALAGHTQDAKKEMLGLYGTDVFGTPKPEKLLQTLLYIATNPGDLILDSFLGSGTTAAVAHKMGRRYIGIELGEHAETHCVPRLKKVIDGEQGGISEMVNWKGGGGFRFYRLGEAVFDEEGRINPKVKFAALAAHVWFTETGRPLEGSPKKPFLGLHDGIAYGLLYNGVLGDKSVNGGNVLTSVLLEHLKREAKGHAGPWVIYGEATRLSNERLRALRVTFKQTPYDIRAR
ncbi:MAG: site-specific DNA-methyltransferase [Candidatus Margulisiibacteriota bacterium]